LAILATVIIVAAVLVFTIIGRLLAHDPDQHQPWPAAQALGEAQSLEPLGLGPSPPLAGRGRRHPLQQGTAIGSAS
jgi:hypothetical protein